MTMAADDGFALHRFVTAQDPILADAERELRGGQKRSHWMWFMFPQLAGLGRSEMARHFAITSIDEARAYLAHPVLGPRLIAITQIASQVENRTANQIFGTPDDVKFQSCMTLFATAAPTEPVFRTALQRYFDDTPDAHTIALLSPSTQG